MVLESGKGGKYYEATRVRALELGLARGIPNSEPAIARHVETQFVSRMIELGVEHAEIEINRPVCGTTLKDQQWVETCDKQLPRFFPGMDADGQGRDESDGQEVRWAGGGEMSMTAGWAVVHQDGSYEGMNTTLNEPEEVHAFVARIAAVDPSADCIRIDHNDRALWDSERGFRDHDVYANVVDGFGYLSHQDRNHGRAYPVGDPRSAGCEFDDDDFPADSGLSLDQLTEALVEFLRTAERPTNVQWTGR